MEAADWVKQRGIQDAVVYAVAVELPMRAARLKTRTRESSCIPLPCLPYLSMALPFFGPLHHDEMP